MGVREADVAVIENTIRIEICVFDLDSVYRIG